MANISKDAVETINKKLTQADAITSLLMSDCDTDMQINDDLRSSALWTVSDLIIDAKKLFREQTEHKEITP